MTGHHDIIRARLAGFCPTSIFIWFGFEPLLDGIDEAGYATVTVPPEEVDLPWNDLRFAAGCTVFVQSPTWTEPFRRFLKELARSADKIIATATDNENDPNAVVLLERENRKWSMH